MSELPEGVRHDGRKPTQLRPVSIERHFLKHVPGSVLIGCGDTRLIISAIAEEGVPGFRAESGGGWLTAEYAMLPAATNTRSTRRSGGREKEIQRLIGRSLRAVVDLDALGPFTVHVDCDVIQADGGTRTAAITGAYLALSDCLAAMKQEGRLAAEAAPLKEAVAAVSVGIVGGRAVLDLDYPEDSAAEVDFNVVMTASQRFVEIQGTAEAEPFSQGQLQSLLGLAQQGIGELLTFQRQALGQ